MAWGVNEAESRGLARSRFCGLIAPFFRSFRWKPGGSHRVFYAATDTHISPFRLLTGSWEKRKQGCEVDLPLAGDRGRHCHCLVRPQPLLPVASPPPTVPPTGLSWGSASPSLPCDMNRAPLSRKPGHLRSLQPCLEPPVMDLKLARSALTARVLISSLEQP